MLDIGIKGNPKVSFSLATTPRCMGGYYSFQLIAPPYLLSVPYHPESEARRIKHYI